MKWPALVWGEGGPVIHGHESRGVYDMSRDEAIAALNDEWAQGDMDSDEYHMECQRIDYEHGEAMSAMDDRRVTA